MGAPAHFAKANIFQTTVTQKSFSYNCMVPERFATTHWIFSRRSGYRRDGGAGENVLTACELQLRYLTSQQLNPILDGSAAHYKWDNISTSGKQTLWRPSTHYNDGNGEGDGEGEGMAWGQLEILPK